MSLRFLMITPTPPYPMHQGNALRNFGILCGLADAGYEVTLLTSQHEAADLAPLRARCHELIVVPAPTRSTAARLRDLVARPLPDLALRLESATFQAALTQLLTRTQFDIIQFEGLETAIYFETVRALQPDALLCYDAHNAEYALQRNIAQVEDRSLRRLPAALYSTIQSKRIAAFERAVCAAVDGVITVSDEDAAALHAFRPYQVIHVLPNGIFADSYRRTEADVPLALGTNALVFTGKMDYRPNVDAILWFTDAILPRIRAQIPDVRLYIVGQQPHAALSALRAQSNIEITGWVPEVRPYLQAAAVYIAPLRMGSGTRLKLLEAMAAHCAIVATPAAASGLNARACAAMRLAASETTFAEAITHLLGNSSERQALGDAAQAAVRADYDWQALTPRLLALYQTLLNARSEKPTVERQAVDAP